MTEKDLATETGDVDRPWMVEDGLNVAHEKSWLKPRHLYMIALGGKQASFIFLKPPSTNQSVT